MYNLKVTNKHKYTRTYICKIMTNVNDIEQYT